MDKCLQYHPVRRTNTTSPCEELGATLTTYLVFFAHHTGFMTSALLNGDDATEQQLQDKPS